MPVCENKELPALNGIDEMLVLGVWPLPVLFGTVGDVSALGVPWARLLGGRRLPPTGRGPAGGYVLRECDA